MPWGNFKQSQATITNWLVKQAQVIVTNDGQKQPICVMWFDVQDGKRIYHVRGITEDLKHDFPFDGSPYAASNLLMDYLDTLKKEA